MANRFRLSYDFSKPAGGGGYAQSDLRPWETGKLYSLK